MFKQDRVAYLKLDQEFTYAKNGETVVDITNCWGKQSVKFLTNPEDSRTSVDTKSQHNNEDWG